MKLGPTSTNDQDDNKRPARYLECQPGSKREKVNGFVNMVMRRIKKVLVSVMRCSFSSTIPRLGDETHIEQRLSDNFDEIRSRSTQIEQFRKTLVLSVARCTRISG